MPDTFALAHARRVASRLEREANWLEWQLTHTPFTRTEENRARLIDLDRRWRVWAAFVELHDAAREVAA